MIAKTTEANSWFIDGSTFYSIVGPGPPSYGDQPYLFYWLLHSALALVWNFGFCLSLLPSSPTSCSTDRADPQLCVSDKERSRASARTWLPSSSSFLFTHCLHGLISQARSFPIHQVKNRHFGRDSGLPGSPLHDSKAIYNSNTECTLLDIPSSTEGGGCSRMGGLTSLYPPLENNNKNKGGDDFEAVCFCIWCRKVQHDIPWTEANWNLLLTIWDTEIIFTKVH